MSHPAHRQTGFGVRFDWGPTGAAAVAADVEAAVVVDVLSFTTTTVVAVEAGAAVLPWRWRDDSARQQAEARDAVLAVGRSVATAGQPSLSPAGMQRAARPGMRVLLPSPNGATIAHGLAAGTGRCVAGSLRNASAVGRWIAEQRLSRVAVIAAGERWPDGSLRPAVEDLWGAGAVIDALLRHTGDGDPSRAPSPEALVARAAFLAVAPGLHAALTGCASGRELVDGGFGTDVALAAELDASCVVPVLEGDAFVPATGVAATLRP